MTPDELRALLEKRGVGYSEKSIQHGTRFDCKTGEMFNVYETGKMSFQRKQNTALALEIKAIYQSATVPVQPSNEAGMPAAPTSTQKDQPVFIVYGHDTPSRDQLELTLRRMRLHPIVLGNLAASGDTIIEKLEGYLGEHGNVGFACVLLTPDDEGHKAGKPEDKKYRARQNVVLEMGMVLARLGRKRVPYCTSSR